MFSIFLQKKVYKTAFDKFDADKSGSIDGSELTALFTSLNWEDSDGTLVDQALKFLDKDISAQIEFEEFMRFTEFSWKYVATNTVKTVEPGILKPKIKDSKIIEELQDIKRKKSAVRESFLEMEENDYSFVSDEIEDKALDKKVNFFFFFE